MVWVEPIAINTSMNNIKDPLQILQIWFSSSFPIGSYAYSHGLESLIDNKKIENKSDVMLIDSESEFFKYLNDKKDEN